MQSNTMDIVDSRSQQQSLQVEVYHREIIDLVNDNTPTDHVVETSMKSSTTSTTSILPHQDSSSSSTTRSTTTGMNSQEEASDEQSNRKSLKRNVSNSTQSGRDGNKQGKLMKISSSSPSRTSEDETLPKTPFVATPSKNNDTDNTIMKGDDTTFKCDMITNESMQLMNRYLSSPTRSTATTNSTSTNTNTNQSSSSSSSSSTAATTSTSKIEAAAKMHIANPFISTAEQAMRLVGCTDEETKDEEKQQSVIQRVQILLSKQQGGNNPTTTTTTPMTFDCKPPAKNVTNERRIVVEESTTSKKRKIDIIDLTKKEIIDLTDSSTTTTSQEISPPRPLFKSNNDLAWNFVERVLYKDEKIQNSFDQKTKSSIGPIATDAMFFVAKTFFECREKFGLCEIPIHVTLAYHYTQERHVQGIAQDGLICSTRGKFGPGVYLCKNAMAFHTKGPVGLLVAIMKGVCTNVDLGSTRQQHLSRRRTIRGHHNWTQQQQRQNQNLLQSQPPQPSQLESRSKKELFLVFLKVLMKYLDNEDPVMLSSAKEVVNDCAKKKKDGVAGYESLSAVLRSQLRATVGDHHWQKAQTYLTKYLCDQYQKKKGLSPIDAHVAAQLDTIKLALMNAAAVSTSAVGTGVHSSGNNQKQASSTSTSAAAAAAGLTNKPTHAAFGVPNSLLTSSKLEEEETFNTIIGQSHSWSDFCDEIVLQESDQCIPIIRFDSSLVERNNLGEESPGHAIIWKYHQEIQRIIDVFCNYRQMNSNSSEGKEISINEIFPDMRSGVARRRQPFPPPPPPAKYPPSSSRLASLFHQSALMQLMQPMQPLPPLPPPVLTPINPLFNCSLLEMDALSLLLSIESLSVHKAMSVVGFKPSDVNDAKIKEGLKKKVQAYRSHKKDIAQIQKCSGRLKKVAEVIVTSFSTFQSAIRKTNANMEPMLRQDILLEIVVEYSRNPPDYLKERVQVYKAAQMMVFDNQYLTTKDALALMGLPDEPRLQVEVNRQRCDLSLSLGIVDAHMKSGKRATILQSKANATLMSSTQQKNSQTQSPAIILQAASMKQPAGANIIKNGSVPNAAPTQNAFQPFASSFQQMNPPLPPLNNTTPSFLLPPPPAAHSSQPSQTNPFATTSLSATAFHPTTTNQRANSSTHTFPMNHNRWTYSTFNSNTNNLINITPTSKVDKGSNETLLYEAPDTLLHKVHSKLKSVINPQTIDKDSTCAICLCPMQRHELLSTISIHNCNHTFHDSCIMQAVKHKPRCPICRINISDEPQGQSPSGSMTITSSKSLYCAGYESCSRGTITITYHLHGGIQKEYHPSPGKSYRGTTRIAYLPDNDDGQALLKRLKYAFRCGLSFQIGTSMTTGMSDCITWSSIHHKSRLSGGVRCHGFPDDKYMLNCNSELDSLGVPKHNEMKN